MAQERYEIRDKLGQGGLGTVHAAWDRNLNREVAIKRIRRSNDDEKLEDEATRQMTQETGALAALQHPHIVTIYDVGSDDEGPFVVMELLKGETIDAIVSKAPLTFTDFREFAMQVQEGLIAAQDLGLVHRDLKPSNVMVNWLPSGKFQVKLVDFGLAKFAPEPSEQTVDQNDSVYGSIFFMAPEQFERVPLDTRTDMYSIGCVYYFALTGQTPFQGDTGPQVMAAHLQHRVVALAELRPDVPRWLADWVMWHINRMPDERPENAREALRNFIELDIPGTQAMSTENSEPTPEAPKRPRLIIPGATPQETAPQPAAPAQATPPAPAAPAQPVVPAPAAQPAPEAQPTPPPAAPSEPTPAAETPAPAPAAPAPETSEVRPAPVPTQTSPQPLSPPAGAPPSVHTTGQQAGAAAAETAPNAPPPAPAVVPAAPAPAPAPAVAVPTATSPAQPAVVPTAPAAAGATSTVPLAGKAVPQGGVATPAAAPVAPAMGAPLGQRPAGATPPGGGMALPQKKQGMPAGAKVAIASILGIFVIGLGIMLVQLMGGNNQTEIYNALVAEAAKPETTELAVDSEKLEILLNSTRAGSNKSRETVYKALSIAQATDGTDVDARIAEFATKEILPTDIRVSLLSRVLRKRASPAIKPYLLEFARSTDNDQAAAAALTAVIEVGGEEEFDDFLDVIQFSPSAAVRRAAEKATAEVIQKSDKKDQLGSTLATASQNVNDDNRRTMIRLLGFTGSDSAKEIVTAAIEGDDNLDKLAAIEALKNWSDESMFETLMEFLEEQTDEQLRPKAFDAGYQFLMSKDRNLDDLDAEDYWKMLARNAKTEREQNTIIGGLAKTETSDWALSVIEYFADEAESDYVIDRAEKAISHIKERRRVKGEDE